MRKKEVTIPTYDAKGLAKEVFSSLILKSEHDYRNSIITITIDKELLPELLALAHGYTKYSIQVAFNSSSIYTSKLYKLASHWRDKGFFEISIERLREILGIVDKYDVPSRIKKWIIDPATDELKERGDVWP